jgi:peptidoglycan/xylan/chitin deacetylase (PgdA/CDA1 family)
MRLDRFLTLWLFRPWRALVPATGPRLPVLMYHSISDDPEPTFSPYYKVCTSPKRFAEQMQWLADDGYRGVTLSEGLAALRKEESDKEHGPERKTDSIKDSHSALQNQKRVAITFDDGFRDFHTAAAPILRKHGFTATMYLPTAFIGDERKSFKGRECLTWEEVRELQSGGMEFGSHTVNHPVLVKLDWPEIETELRDSKATLERRLGETTRAFAYPFAFPQANRPFCTRFLEVVQATAYESCVTTDIGTFKSGNNPLQVKRLPANSADDKALFRAKLAGAYSWIAGPQKAVKHFKSLRLQRRPQPA